MAKALEMLATLSDDALTLLALEMDCTRTLCTETLLTLAIDLETDKTLSTEERDAAKTLSTEETDVLAAASDTLWTLSMRLTEALLADILLFAADKEEWKEASETLAATEATDRDALAANFDAATDADSKLLLADSAAWSEDMEANDLLWMLLANTLATLEAEATTEATE